ncbi:MAG: oligosaccharide flippase family protein [Clostridia bacterium]|nr:oligosaccharide flippase family protein [Clostridia bacterium]
MKKSRLFVTNTLLLTATAFIIRAVGVAYNVYITGLVGERGVGIFQLVMSVYGFALTLATSGVNLAATRLCAEAQTHDEERAAMRGAFLYASLFGGGAAALLFLLADPIGRYLLADEASVISLRALSLSLPAISMGSALAGYFNARRAAVKSASAQLFEQAVRIFACIMLLKLLLPRGDMYACFAMTAGGAISEWMSFLYSFALYRWEQRKKRGNTSGRKMKELCAIAIPVALSAYARSALVCVEHLLIPYGLAKSGLGKDGALASYGVFHGMVMPLVTLPMALLSSMASLLVPELAGLNAAEDSEGMVKAAKRACGFALIFGVGCAGVMMTFAGELGELLYNSADAGKYIRIMAPLIPIMYVDHIVDSMLKGADLQLQSMRINIADSMLCVLLIYLLLPKYGIMGYAAVLYISEMINASLSITVLTGKIPFEKGMPWALIRSLLAVVGAACATRLIFSSGVILVMGRGLSLVLNILCCVFFYLLLIAALRVPESMSLPLPRITLKKRASV